MRFAISSLISGGNQILSFSDLPATAKGPVHPHQIAGDVAQGASQIVLLIQERLLRDRTVVKSSVPSRYCRIARSRERLAAVALLAQKSGPLLGLQKSDQIVLHFLLGCENSVLISDEQLLEPGILHPDIVRDLAIIEDVPLD